MKKCCLIFTIFYVVYSFNVSAQYPDWKWAKSFGSTVHDKGYSIHVDNSSNIYTSGVFFGAIDLDPGPGVFNVGSRGAFISKLSDVGDFIWGGAFNGTCGIYKIAPGLNNKIIAAGSFANVVDFDPGPGVNNDTAIGIENFFICQFDSSGDMDWLKVFGGINYQIVADLIVSTTGDGSIYATGLFYDTIDFKFSTGLMGVKSSGVEDIFIIKLDSQGELIWAKTVGGYGDDRAFRMAMDSEGSHIYLTGYYSDTADFDPGPDTSILVTQGLTARFIAKYDSAGNYIWAKQFGDRDTLYPSVNTIAVDPVSGDIFITATNSGTNDFDPGPGTYNISSLAFTERIVCRLDSAGNLIWAKQVATPAGNADVLIFDGIQPGSFYLGGTFNNWRDFDPGPGEFKMNSPYGRCFLASFDGLGNFGGAIQWGASVFDIIYDMRIDAYGRPHVIGDFWNLNVTFGQTTLVNTTSGQTDVYVAQLDSNFITRTLEPSVNSVSTMLVFPNPALHSIRLDPYPDGQVRIFNSQGQLMRVFELKPGDTAELDIDNLNPGIYCLQAGSQIRKFIKN